MTLNASGPISLGGSTTGQSINLELGVSATAQASINSTSFRTLAGVASGQISLSNFYGKSNIKSMWITEVTASEFNRSFNDLYQNSIALDSSDNVYVAATGRNNVSGNVTQYYTYIKLTANGAASAGTYINFSGHNNVASHDLALDSSANVYGTGRSYNISTSLPYGQLIKLNSSLTLQSQERVLRDAGYTRGPVVYSSNVFLIGGGLGKYNTSLSAVTVVGNSDANFYTLRTDSSGNVYAFGVGPGGNAGAMIIKYNSSLSITWQRNAYVASQYWYADGGDVDASGNVGVATHGGGLLATAHILYYNSSGTIQWQRKLSNSQDTSSVNCAFDSSGNLYAIGYTNVGAGTGTFVVKYNSSGTLQWQRTLSGTQQPGGIVVKSSGIYILCIKDATTSPPVIVCKLPLDGSGTGTYGSYTYAVGTMTEGAGVLTTGTPSTSNTSGALSNYGSGGGSAATATITATVIL